MSFKLTLLILSNMERNKKQITVFTVLSILFIICLLIIVFNQQIIEYYAKR